MKNTTLREHDNDSQLVSLLLNGPSYSCLVPKPRCHNDKLGFRATKEVQEKVMDLVQMVTIASRTAGGLLTLFSTMKTVTILTINPIALHYMVFIVFGHMCLLIMPSRYDRFINK